MESQLKQLVLLFEECSKTNDAKGLEKLESQIIDLSNEIKNNLKSLNNSDSVAFNTKALEKIIAKMSKKQNSRLSLINDFKDYLEKNKVV